MFADAMGHLKVLVEHGAESKRDRLLLQVSRCSLPKLSGATYLEIDDRGRRFVSGGGYRFSVVVNILKLETYATYHRQLIMTLPS